MFFTKLNFFNKFLVAPITAIIVINCCILCKILYEGVKRGAQLGYSKSMLRVQLIVAFTLMFNFGIPWLIFIFYVGEYSHALSYIFIVINGTQVWKRLMNWAGPKGPKLLRHPVNNLRCLTVATPRWVVKGPSGVFFGFNFLPLYPMFLGL